MGCGCVLIKNVEIIKIYDILLCLINRMLLGKKKKKKRWYGNDNGVYLQSGVWGLH